MPPPIRYLECPTCSRKGLYHPGKRYSKDYSLAGCRFCKAVFSVEWNGEEINSLTSLKQKKGFPFGETHPFAKLNEEQVKEIRQLWFMDMTQKSIAGIYGVSQKTVSLIVSNKTWRGK